MRKTLAFLGALVLCAAPAAAQSSGPSAPLENAAPTAVERAAARPSLFPSTDAVREQVRANEDAREAHGAKATTTHDWLYLVAAIAVGVIIAAVVLH
jgi:hypothetical protein